ncbi:HalOD1 output domain-containing protein [Halorussus caseinilyticus]|uniref:HalOD1 output domain-containing protein n=1 Tax=Halorussus caseinilyticus TaxID=3034025 RepID=A0ABD5WEI0_9EURY|nr:HalOD1 output domain-containing protein [Halorussus sp. DT72]
MNAEDSSEILTADPDAGTYRVTYDYPSNPPSIAVPLAIAETTGCGLTDLEPLYDAEGVDPDALDDLFRPNASGIAPECRVTFGYHGYEVTVKSYGRIVIRSPAASSTTSHRR